MPDPLVIDTGVLTLKDKDELTVCLGIACNKWQSPEYWVPLFAPRGNVTHFTWSRAGVYKFDRLENLTKFINARGALTDTNRNQIIEYFLYDTDCDYLFQLDDDVRIYHSLDKTISRLLSHEYPICAGIYYRGSEPYGPLVFVYSEEDQREGYTHLVDWEPDSMVRVDAVGMGCTMIHREVFLRMKEEFLVVENWRGEFRLEHPDDLKEHMAPSDEIIKAEDLPDYARFPWYALSYCRTEDMYFCENAKRLGYDIWCDTSLELDHLQTQPIHRGHFLRARKEGEVGEGEKRVWRRQ